MSATSFKLSAIVCRILGSPLVRILVLEFILVMLIMAVKRGKIVPPMWKRSGQ